MNFFTGFLRTIILLGTVQGFIVSCMLFFSKKNRQSNVLLGVIILLMSLACFNLYADYANWFGSDLLRFIGQLVPLIVIMPLGPLIYFYIQSSLDANFKFIKKHRRHFYPVIIDIVPQLAVIIFIIGILTNTIKNNPKPWGNFIDTYNVYADIPRWISVTTYLWLSSKYLSAFRKKYNGSLNGLTTNFKWTLQLVRVFFGFQILWLIYLVPYVIPRYTDVMLDTFDWYPLYIPLAVMIYWLGIKGYIITQQLSVKKIPGNNISLTAQVIKETISLLNTAMEKDKIYLNPNCTLPVLSEHINVSQKTISAVLNQHLHKSFNEFINEFRVNAFKEKIQKPEMEQLTIAGVAFECGFNSQATFQRTFKQITGLSPSEFRNTVAQTD
jgi:AraC-like DNA-binding protein